MSVNDIHSDDFNFDEYCKQNNIFDFEEHCRQNNITLKKNGYVMVMPPTKFTYKNHSPQVEKE